MKKLFQLLGNDEPTDGTYGIEIEAEGEGMQEVRSKYWRTENDGSLRGEYPEQAAEFVLKKPINIEHVEDALKSLKASLKDAEFKFSFRTSVHVHANMTDLTPEQVLNTIYTYLLLEEPLMTYCGKDRKANRFCLRIVDAEGLVDTLYHLFNDFSGNVMRFAGDGVRYSAINIAALQKYGSLEFRAMRGNMDVETIHTWVKAIDRIRTYAMGKNNPREILEEFRNSDPKEFMAMVLKDVYHSFTYPRMVKEMQRSFSLSLDLPYAYKIKEEVVKKPVSSEQTDLEAFIHMAKNNMQAFAHVPFAPPVAPRPRAPRPIRQD